MLDDPGRAEHRTALGAEGLGERHGGHDIAVTGEPGGPQGTAASVAQDAQTVRVVDEQRGARGPADPGERGERRGVAVDREDRVGHGERPAVVAGQRRAHGLGVGVRGHFGTGPGEPAAVDEGGVVARVGDDQGAGGGERGDGGEVRGITG